MKRESKTTRSPPSLSPPPKKAKEEELSINEDDLEERIERLKKPKDPKVEVISIQKKVPQCSKECKDF